MYRVALFGLPTAGKSTLSNLAAARLTIPQINVGQILREESFLSKRWLNEISRGNMLRDQEVMAVVARELNNIGRAGFLLDGFPRNLKQLTLFEQHAFSQGCQFVYLGIDVQTVQSRFLQRMICSNCRRADYLENRAENPRCVRCGEYLITRPDATLKAFEQKMINYNKYEKPLIQHLEDKGYLLKLTVEGKPSQDLEPLLDLLVMYG